MNRRFVATVVAFASAAVTPALGFAMTAFVAEGNRPWPEQLLAAGAFFGAALSMSSMLAILVGLPAYLALARLGLVRWWTSTSFGTAVGVSFAFFGGIHGFNGATIAALGLLGGLAFWVVWKRGLPRPSEPGLSSLE